MRRFHLIRDEDATGISGTGHIADGVMFDDGKCVTRWRGAVAQTCVWDSLADIKAVHGHGGKTRVEFIGKDPTAANQAPAVRSPIIALAEGDYCIVRDDSDGWNGLAQLVDGYLKAIDWDGYMSPDSDHVHILRRVRLVDYDTGEELSA